MCGGNEAFLSNYFDHLLFSLLFLIKGYFAPDRGAKYCDERVCVSVRLSVCPRITKTHVRTSRNFLYVLPVAVARSSSDDNAIRYCNSGFVYDLIVRGSQLNGRRRANRRHANQSLTLSVASQKVRAVSRRRDRVSVGKKSMRVLVVALHSTAVCSRLRPALSRAGHQNIIGPYRF